MVGTSRGYLLASAFSSSGHRAVLAVRHGPNDTEDELSLLLDLGVRVVDVVVDHPIYGELRGMLMLDSRDDLREWLSSLKERNGRLLSELTGGNPPAHRGGAQTGAARAGQGGSQEERLPVRR